MVPNKVWQAMAAGRPVVTADTPGRARGAARTAAPPSWCRPGTPRRWPARWRRLAGDAALRASIGSAARAAYLERGAPAAVATSACATRSHRSNLPGMTTTDRVHDWGERPELFGPRHDYREALILRRLLPALPGPAVLNAGAGAGSLTLRLVERACG